VALLPLWRFSSALSRTAGFQEVFLENKTKAKLCIASLTLQSPSRAPCWQSLTGTYQVKEKCIFAESNVQYHRKDREGSVLN